MFNDVKAFLKLGWGTISKHQIWLLSIVIETLANARNNRNKIAIYHNKTLLIT